MPQPQPAKPAPYSSDSTTTEWRLHYLTDPGRMVHVLASAHGVIVADAQLVSGTVRASGRAAASLRQLGEIARSRPELREVLTLAWASHRAYAYETAVKLTAVSA